MHLSCHCLNCIIALYVTVQGGGVYSSLALSKIMHFFVMYILDKCQVRANWQMNLTLCSTNLIIVFATILRYCKGNINFKKVANIATCTFFLNCNNLT